MRRLLNCLAIAGGVLSLASAVPADVRYTIQDLGHGSAYDINNLGQVIGNNGQQGYLWSAGQYTSLADRTTNFLFPRALNIGGQVVGSDHKAFPDGSYPVLALLYDRLGRRTEHPAQHPSDRVV